MRQSLQLIKTSLMNLTVHKLRSFLTILSMVFGTGAVIATLNSNEGAKIYISQQLASLGTSLIRIETRSSTGIKEEHRALIGKYGDLIKSTSFELTTPQISVRSDSKASYASLYGVNRNYFDDLNFRVIRGRVFDSWDESRFLPVALIGSKLKKTLFGKTYAIGSEVSMTIDGAPFTVQIIGEIAEKGANSNGSVDEGILISATLAKKIATTATKSNLIAIMQENVVSTQAKLQVQGILQAAFKDSLAISDARETIEKTKSIWENQNFVGLCLAAISLLTGGVGIMNIMLLSINQRRREIGLRKAIGANPTDICLQFLVEAATVCFIGGMIGTLFGSLFGEQVAKMMGQWEAITSFKTVGLALIFSTLTGIVFGLFPALRASKLDPYEALRG